MSPSSLSARSRKPSPRWQHGVVQAAALSYPLYPKAQKSGMRELVNFADLGVEDINGTVITTRAFVAQQRDTALRFMRAFTRGMQRYRTDKEFSKKVLAKYGKIERRGNSRRHLARLCADAAKKPAPVAQGDSVHDREPVSRQKAAAETRTIRRLVDRRSVGKKRLYRLGR